MAKVTGVATQLSGKVGQLIYSQTKYGTVAYEAPAKASVPRRSEAQMQVRTQWSNLAAMFKQFHSTLKRGWEGLNGRMSDYNAFIQANTNVVAVYVPKQVRLNGGSVLAPYQITRGGLPSIAMTTMEDAHGRVLVSDIELGSLVIDAETTVGAFAAAVVSCNVDWAAGDQLTFFYGEQMTDAVTGIPRARIYGQKVVLDPADETALLDVVSELGFTSVAGATGSGYKLGMSRSIVDGAAVWIHSREEGTGGLKVSTQFLYVDSSVLAGYQGADAMATSAASYGGINTGSVYLQPRSGGSSGGGATGNGATDSGNNGATEQGNDGATEQGNNGGSGGSGSSSNDNQNANQNQNSGGGDGEGGDFFQEG